MVHLMFTQAAEEFLNEFGGNPIKTPFQDGHYILVIAVVEVVQVLMVILYVADLENPSNFNKKLQP